MTRIKALDGLRGVAVIGVLLYHYTYWYEHVIGPHAGMLFRFPWGKFGVELFFVISGFVITMTLERTRGLHAFLVARITRLYPAFIVSLGFTATISYLLAPPALRWTWREVDARRGVHENTRSVAL